VTNSSGFTTNSLLFDGTSWKTEKNMHTDTIRTEYRNRFNKAKGFHKNDLKASTGRMIKKMMVYDVEDL
jgi:hypothetical protein